MPGLINAHAHLEFSDLAQPYSTAGGFTDWIARVVQGRAQRQGEHASYPTDAQAAWVQDRRRAWQAGLLRSWQAGVRCIVDMITPPWQPDWFFSTKHERSLEMELFALVEQMDPTETRREELQRFSLECRRQFDEQYDLASELRLRLGLAPHAPYTTSLAVLEECVQSSLQRQHLISMHLAETREELQWLTDASGPLAAMLARFAQQRSQGASIGQYLRSLLRAHKILIAHGNYLDEEGVEQVLAADNRAAIVYCPRTHAAFGHEPHRFVSWMQRGIQVLLGTDSLASNPDLSILEEARFVYRQTPQLGAGRVLRLVTRDAAQFLRCAWYRDDLVGMPFSFFIAIPCLARRAGAVSEHLLLGNEQPMAPPG
jgi:cytosine/adenosine deaminase-related metal-dependent hydrolase